MYIAVHRCMYIAVQLYFIKLAEVHVFLKVDIICGGFVGSTFRMSTHSDQHSSLSVFAINMVDTTRLQTVVVVVVVVVLRCLLFEMIHDFHQFLKSFKIMKNIL